MKHPRQCTQKKIHIHNPLFKKYSKEEKLYFKSLPEDEQHAIANAEGVIAESNNTTTPIRFKVINSNADMIVKTATMKKFEQVKDSDPTSAEYNKTMKWITSMCDIPIGNYKELAVNAQSSFADISEFVRNIKSNLDAKVFGHQGAKDQVVRLICQWISNPKSKGMVIGIQGPMGCGKTTLVKEGICKAIDIPFAFIPLGGASGSEYLDGHNSTYVGSTWGKIVQSLMDCKCMNPVLFFDELDKVSDTPRGEEIINYFVHLTDSTQNDKITDKYFSEMQFDLSKSLIIFSYNDEKKVNPILRDRMFRIYTKKYEAKEKVELAKNYLLPEILKEYAMAAGDICLRDETVMLIIDRIEKEDGVRNLKRALQDIVGHVNMKKLLEAFELPYTVQDHDIARFVSTDKPTNGPFNSMYI